MRILGQVGVTCIMITHDQEDAMIMAHRLAVMIEGQIVQMDTPQEGIRVSTFALRGGLHRFDQLCTGTIELDEPDRVTIECDEFSRPLVVSHGVSEPIGMEVHVSIRPEHVVVSRDMPETDANWAHGRVMHMAWLGRQLCTLSRSAWMPARWWKPACLAAPHPGAIGFPWHRRRGLRQLRCRQRHGAGIMIRVPVARLLPSMRTLVIAPSFVWLTIFLLVPFLMVLKISFADIEFGTPSYTPLFEFEDGVTNFTLHTQGYAQLMLAVSLPLYANLVKLDLRLLEAAYDLGAKPWQAFWRVTVPLLRPGVIAGAMLVFIP